MSAAGAAGARRLVAAIALVVLAACGREPHGDDSVRPPANLADLGHVAEEDRTTFDDLPGIEGLDALAEPQRAWVIARANEVRCDCGCIGHSINSCLHQREECTIAERMASMLVEDARTLEAAMIARGLSPASPPEASAPEGATNATDEAAAPGGEAAADGGAPEGGSLDGGATPADALAPAAAGAPADGTAPPAMLLPAPPATSPDAASSPAAASPPGAPAAISPVPEPSKTP